jgi:hypothetical protein
MILFIAEGRVMAFYDDRNAPAVTVHPGCQRIWVPDDTTFDASDPLCIPDPRPTLGPDYVTAQAKRELADLDSLLPRAVEDINAAMAEAGIALTLPLILRDRMARKAALRAIVAGGDHD